LIPIGGLKVKRAKGKIENALIQVYTGDGKGKTTAALGIALRAAGHGYKARIIQFMKGSTYYGELYSAERLAPEVEIYQFGRDCRIADAIRAGTCKCDNCMECFVRKGDVKRTDLELAAEAYVLALRTLKYAEADIVVLDELTNAIHFDLLTVDDCVKLIGQRASGVELIITGRNAPKEIIALADLVTEMKLIKHPFDKGIAARRGIEY
jgi:cob(I)alamin adenosyltransferase